MTFAALRHRQFRLLFAGLVSGNVGIWMQEFALGWLVVQLAVRDGNPSLAGLYLGLRSLASAVPALGFGLFAGVFVDRTDRRDLLLATRSILAVIAAVLAVLVITDHVNIVIVMLLSAATSAVFAFDFPGRQAIVPSIVPVRDLFSAMGLTRASMQAAQAIGPLIAGLLIVPIGIAGVLLTKVALAIASLGVMLRMKRQPPHPSAGDLGVLASLREGLGYIGRDDLIRWCVILQLVLAVFAQSYTQLLPAVAVETFRGGSTELSWLAGAAGLGALIGAFLIARAARVERRGGLLLVTLFAFGATLALFGAQRSVAGALVLLVLLGVLQQLFLGTLGVILQIAAPDRLRGRIMGMQSLIYMSCGPLGVLAIGALGTVTGVSTAILIGGLVLSILTIAVAARVPVIRELRSLASEREPAGAALVAPSPAAGAE